MHILFFLLENVSHSRYSQFLLRKVPLVSTLYQEKHFFGNNKKRQLLQITLPIATYIAFYIREASAPGVCKDP